MSTFVHERQARAPAETAAEPLASSDSRLGALDPRTLSKGDPCKLRTEIAAAVALFVTWLEKYGEVSYDYQTFYAGGLGGRAKALYYRSKIPGMVVVAPLVLLEAFCPASRRLFWKPQRFPIADAHYAMAFALLTELTGDQRHYHRAVHFLDVLEQTRCPGYEYHAWGYPFDWVTRTGVMRSGTPLITTTAYVYEAFEHVYRQDGDDRWLSAMRSIAEHALRDFRDHEVAPGCATVGYNPDDTVGGVVNASAYRSFLLFKAATRFSRDDFHAAAVGNLNFVLRSQKVDGSWFYAEDGVRDFIDHFHTCFVLKSLAKIEAEIAPDGCRQAIERGVEYYVQNLFDDEGLPRPFARAPRLTIYRRELYDYAECINLGTLLLGRFPQLDQRVETALLDLLRHWSRRDGSFRSRRLWLGWDDVPMHRWAQSQVFRSLCYYMTGTQTPMPAAVAGVGCRTAGAGRV